MMDRVVGKHSFRRGLLLVGTITMAAVMPAAFCQNDSSQNETAPHTATQDVNALEFDVATIKPTPKSNNFWKMEFTPDGFTANGVFLRKIIQEAYGVYEEDRMTQGPVPLMYQSFDIEAKMDGAAVTNVRDISLDQRRAMLQRLLADRFQLKIHHEIRQLPVYALLVAKNGPKLHQSQPDQGKKNEIRGYTGLVKRSANGLLEIQGFSMAWFATLLSGQVHRTVLDRTGLTGYYDLTLQWTPDDLPGPKGAAAVASQQGNVQDTSWPPIFAALPEQLGLKLESAKGPVDVLVIDHVETPSEN